MTTARGATRPVGWPGWGRRGGMVLLVLGGLAPLVPLLVWSVSGQWRYPALVPQQLSARGLRLLVDTRSGVPAALGTSAVIAVVVAVLACLIGFPAGRALGLYRFRGRTAVRFLLLAPVLVPGLAAALGIQVLFIHYGLSGGPTGVVLVQLLPSVPYAATILAGAFANLDVDHERQAHALGAGPVRVLLFVTVPLLRPAITVAVLAAFLISWSEYVLTLLIGAGQVRTLPLLLFAAIGSADTTAAAAVALLLVVPPLLLVAVAARTLGGRPAVPAGLGRP